MYISIALCTYNGSSFLAEQLESILQQQLPVQEIVICDDQSTDTTAEIIESYCKQYPSLFRFYVNEQNLGAKKNFEKACSLCMGDIIFCADQDDVWLPQKTAVMVQALEADPTLLAVFSDALLVDDSGNGIGSSFWESLYFREEDQQVTDRTNLSTYILSYANIVAGSMLAFRKSALPLILPFQLQDRMWHDEWITLVLSSTQKIDFIRQPLIKYRLHAGQQIGLGTAIGENPALSRLAQLKNYTNIEENSLAFFNFSWERYQKALQISKFIPTLSPLLPAFHLQALKAKKQLLASEPFWKKKARLFKWSLNRQFETNFSDILSLR